jgi:hypothetical protein
MSELYTGREYCQLVNHKYLPSFFVHPNGFSILAENTLCSQVELRVLQLPPELLRRYSTKRIEN